ncbi:MAG TPA: AbrB family transcriptional regulator [Solirubrobacteraceae bacterium]|nr:AbrB family transcriptional regulator [Solirubrobacteraceae bacterium]
MRRLAPWAALAAATGATGWALGEAGLPSSYLFAGLLVGLAVAIAKPDRLAVPERGFAAAQVVTGVTLGAYLQASALSALGGDWLPVLLASAATLGLSLAAGWALGRFTATDTRTAALGMVAGGASGIVGMADDLGGDDRIVAFMQYARVLIVVLLTPLLVPIAFAGEHATGHAVIETGTVLGDPSGWLLTLALAPAGVLLGRLVRLPAGMLLGPMILSGAVTVLGGDFAVPPVLREVAFAVIGLRIGLRFTVATVRLVGRLLVPVTICILGLLVACFGLAVALHLTTSASLLDAYLATTPGGLYAVVAIAFGTGANATFIVAVQGLRVIVMVLLAPVMVRWLVPRPT